MSTSNENLASQQSPMLTPVPVGTIRKMALIGYLCGLAAIAPLIASALILIINGELISPNKLMPLYFPLPLLSVVAGVFGIVYSSKINETWALLINISGSLFSVIAMTTLLEGNGNPGVDVMIILLILFLLSLYVIFPLACLLSLIIIPFTLRKSGAKSTLPQHPLAKIRFWAKLATLVTSATVVALAIWQLSN